MMNEKSEQIADFPVSELDPHPFAKHFWPETEDRKADVDAICESIAQAGVAEPLLITKKQDASGYWVIDGCTRLEGIVRANLAHAPCILRDIPEESIRDEVYRHNMSRTRFGTGMRVMRYLEMYDQAVLAESKANEDVRKRAPNGRNGNLSSRDDRFSVRAISERLKVSDKDVTAGIELLRCRTENLHLDVSGGLRRYVEADESAAANRDFVYASVLAGKTPLRRWCAAKAGRESTEGKGKADTNYALLAARAAISLRNAFENWSKADWETRAQREKVEQDLAAALAIMPECCRLALLDLIPQSWGPHEKAALAKAIAKK